MMAMDNSTTVQDDIAARNRFESFKLGKGLPSTLSMGSAPKHGHHRSHSRNNSISSTSSLSLSSVPSSKSTSLHDLSSFSFGSSSAHNSLSVISPQPTNPAPPSKRNSHHRRRSSVSTRHESAEMMGVSVPDLPASLSEDNINLGEKDSIRRRALWALEGKPDVFFNKVEIPELSTPEIEKMMFDFPTKPSFPTGSGSSYGNGLNSIPGNKRDSFKLLAASGSSKDQLHTLVEEEEEEDELVTNEPRDSLPSPTSSIGETVAPPSTPLTPTPAVAVTKPTPSKPRPATLHLRPLSLTPENLGSVSNQGLPTPSLTPSPRTGLRSLSLSPANSGDESSWPAPVPARQGLVTSPTPLSRRPVLNLNIDNADSSNDDLKPLRRSSISYKCSSHKVTTSAAGLPTPEMTPTFGRRYSIAESVRSSKSGDDEFFPIAPTQSRPLSTSEQHFLFKSHNALLARITDLERALSVRRTSVGYSMNGSSRPSSIVSEFSSTSESVGSGSGEPSDEMLSFIRDLKAERDELKKDVDGWRTRVSDLDKQLGVVAKRVEAERREAWVARSRVGLLEAEKGVLEKRLSSLDQIVNALEADKDALEVQNGQLKQDSEEKKKRVQELEAELQNVKWELESERMSRKQQADLLATPTPRAFENSTVFKKHGLGFNSVDSESSATDVELECADSHFNFGFPLKVVQETDESGYSDEDDGLAGYEDEDEFDAELETSFSFESLDDQPQRSFEHLKTDLPIPAPPVVPPRPAHQLKPSFPKAWTFPRGVQPPKPVEVEHKHTDSVDRFFGCLEESDADGSDGSAPVSPSSFNYEKSKGIFASGFKYGSSDDDAPFYLPGGVGVVVEEPEAEVKVDNRLAAVTEEEEEDSTTEDEFDGDGEMFGEIGGIRITFTPPDDIEETKVPEKQIQISPIQQRSTAPMLPALNFGDDDEEEDDEDSNDGVIPFNFGRPPVASALPRRVVPNSPPKAVPAIITPPSSLPRPTSPRAASPSSIPRAASRPLLNNTTPKTIHVQASVVSQSQASNAYVTPPTRRGGVMPSFIPQPVSSPSPLRISAVVSKPKVVPGPTFIRPPTRKPLMPSTNGKNQNSFGAANGSTFMPQIATIQHTPMNHCSSRRSSDYNAKIPTTERYSSSEIKMRSIDLPTPGRNELAQVTNTPRVHRSPLLRQESKDSTSSTTSSSFSSIIASPLSGRLSFQSFTNFIPMPWSSRSTASASSTPVPSTSVITSGRSDNPISLRVAISSPLLPPKSGFVSREKQLMKLKQRMDTEGASAMGSSVYCQRCDGALVVL